MDNPLKLKTLNHIEFWGGNAKQAAYYYRHAFGFSQTGYAGLETGQREYTSYALEQGKSLNDILLEWIGSAAEKHIRKGKGT